MARLTPLDLAAARRIGAAFGLQVSAVEALAGGSVNSNFRLEAEGGARFFLRVYEEQNEGGAARELALLGALGHAGVPTPAPLVRADGAPLEAHAGKPVALFPWVEGEILCQARVTPAHAAKVGAALAEVHLARVERPAPGRFERPELEARLARVARDAPAFAGVTEDLSRRLEQWWARRDASLPSGLIHGDLFRDNVLWQGEALAALIDFESASLGVFAYDLMVCVHAWCFGDRFSPELVQGMLQGYHAVRRLGRDELAALEAEGAIAALRFAVTRITDYSLRAPPGQPPLRDYRRFLARLAAIEAGALVAPRASLG